MVRTSPVTKTWKHAQILSLAVTIVDTTGVSEEFGAASDPCALASPCRELALIPYPPIGACNQ